MTSTVTVDGAGEGLVSIEVDITHSWRGDLVVEATAPNGQTFVLHDRGGSSADDLRETFPLDATGSAFEGDPNGTWTLRVSDNADADTGALNGWAVIVGG